MLYIISLTDETISQQNIIFSKITQDDLLYIIYNFFYHIFLIAHSSHNYNCHLLRLFMFFIYMTSFIQETNNVSKKMTSDSESMAFSYLHTNRIYGISLLFVSMTFRQSLPK